MPYQPMTPEAHAYRDQNRMLALVLILAATWQLGAYFVALQLQHPLYACPSRTWLNIPCPLCGLTRGTVAFLRGDVTRAVLWNPLTPVALGAFLLELLYRMLGSSTRIASRLLPWRPLDRRLHLMLAALFVVYAFLFHLWRTQH